MLDIKDERKIQKINMKIHPSDSSQKRLRCSRLIIISEVMVVPSSYTLRPNVDFSNVVGVTGTYDLFVSGPIVLV
jgi:hypothetical protein